MACAIWGTMPGNNCRYVGRGTGCDVAEMIASAFRVLQTVIFASNLGRRLPTLPSQMSSRRNKDLVAVCFLALSKQSNDDHRRWTASFDTDRVRFQSISVMCEQRLRKVRPQQRVTLRVANR